MNPQGVLRAYFCEPSGTVRDLGPFRDGSTVQAFAINDAGQVVGEARLPGSIEDESVAFLYDAETGHATGLPFDVADAINAAGVVLGHTDFGDFFPSETAYVYEAGEARRLGPAADQTWAADINDRGTIIGGYLSGGIDEDPVTDEGLFLVEEDATWDLKELLVPESAAQWDLKGVAGINNLGLIVGTAIGLDGEWRTVLLTPEPVGPTPIPLPPALWPGVALLAALVARCLSTRPERPTRVCSGRRGCQRIWS